MAQHKENSVARAFYILKCLSGGTGKLSEISRKLDINKATVHRLLKTLEKTGLATQDPQTRLYYLGPQIQSLAANPTTVHQVLIHCARVELESLRDISGETVGLQIRQGSQRFILDEVQSNQQLMYFRGKGQSAAVYAGASGKILLSEMSEHDLELLLKSIDLVAAGPNTITDKSLLIREIKKVKKQGYAESLGETFDGAVAIAVPVRGYVCPVALGLVGPQSRFMLKMMSLLEPMKKSAENISIRLQKVSGLKPRA